MSHPATLLRGHAEELVQAFPALLADAEHLAATVLLGVHGRRRSGMGDEFWQHRPAMPGDSARSIDWRRSARSDSQFVQEKEWQAAQSILIWADNARAMAFSSRKDIPTKAARARLLALASAILLVRGGERVALAGERARQGDAQLEKMAQHLAGAGMPDDVEHLPEYGVPDTSALPAHARALFISDFFADTGKLREALGAAADRGIRGALVQVLDAQEEAFPFDGRTVFESMGRSLRHETLKAGDLRARYLERLGQHKTALAAMARETGWQYHCHHTSDPAAGALLWIHGALERRR